MTFSIPAVNIQQGDVGTRYHLGIGNGTATYGYMIAPGSKFEESTDLQSRDKLVSTVSAHLIDRDFVNYPRVTDGDFSGGGLQTIYLDDRRYFDGDLDIRVPGYTILRPGYSRVTKSAITPVLPGQVVAFNNDFWFTFGDAAKNFYSANGGFSHVAGSQIVSLDTDGQYLYAGFTGGLDQYPASGTDVGAATHVATALNGTARQWWVVSQGTQGVYAYYVVGNNTLYKIDLTASFPVAAGSQALVPLGGNPMYVTDIAPYAANIAILTNDVNGEGFDVWFHDGSNLTRIIRIDGYRARGMCNCLGTLYVGAEAISNRTPPVLAKIGSGVFQIVAKAGSPFFTTTSQQCLQPRSSSHYVYWPILNPSLNGVAGASAQGQVVEFDALTGAVAAMPVNDNLDFAGQVGSSINNGLRSVAVLGEGVGSCFYNGTTGYLQYQVTAFGTKAFRNTGWLVSSKLDFNTPSIPKLFRRLIITHAPLNAGEQMLAQAWVDKDPTAFTTTATKGSASNQYTTQVTNSTAGSTQTVLSLPAATVGSSLFFALQLTAGTSNLTSPTVYYVSAEIGVPWVWKFTVNCSAQRNDARGKRDGQGVRGVDLYGLLHNAWESATGVTLVHPNGNSYTAVIESLDFTTDVPLYRDTSMQPKDYEAQCAVVLRQSTV